MSEAERMLKRLVPSAGDLDHGEVMFRAGRASARGWAWPLATLASTAAVAVLAVLLATRPATAPDIGLGPLTGPARLEEQPTPTARPEPLIARRRLEEQVLLHGLEGLGPADPLPAAPAFLTGANDP